MTPARAFAALLVLACLTGRSTVTTAQLRIAPVDSAEVAAQIKRVGGTRYARACLRGDVGSVVVVPWLSLGCESMDDKPLTQSLFRSEVEVNALRQRHLWFFEREAPWVYTVFADTSGGWLAYADGDSFYCVRSDGGHPSGGVMTGIAEYSVDRDLQEIYHVGCIGGRYYYAIDSSGVPGVVDAVSGDPSDYTFTPVAELPER